jgi:hypothetical protein
LEPSLLWVDGVHWQLADLPEPGRIAASICPDDFYFVTDPIRWQIYPAAVTAGFNPFFDHFFTVYFKFDPVVGKIDGRLFIICGILIAVLIFVVWHRDLPLSDS